MKHLSITWLFSCVLVPNFILAQNKSYNDSLLRFREQYIQTHEVVKGHDKTFFRFYEPNENYLVNCRFTAISDSTGFLMRTSGSKTPRYFVAGKISFQLKGKMLQLIVYKSEKLMNVDEYKNYLFVPFTDLSSGEKSYGGGRYLEFYSTEVKKDSVKIDFNKAYNPYCAYASGYNCPIPPRENDLPVAIEAGEMNFGKEHP